MNNYDIQRLIDSPDAMGIVKLPAGEFEGPFTVQRPCRIIGFNTTLWRKSGEVLNIRSRGVSLEDLQIEITGSDRGETAVVTAADDTSFKNTVICGGTQGVRGEDGFWGLPKVISPGRTAPDKAFKMYIETETPSPAEIRCNISGVTVKPSAIGSGRSKVEITVEPLSQGTVIYGEIEFVSALTRRVYLNLSADSNYTAESGKTVYAAPAPPPMKQQQVPQHRRNNAVPAQYGTAQQPSRAPEKAEPKQSSFDGRLIRGQRLNVAEILGTGEITAELFWSMNDGNMDIDAYTFLLDEGGKTWADECLVFFGNKSSPDGNVTYTDSGSHRIVHMNLDKLPLEVQNIAVAYAIYGDDPRKNFSKLHGAVVVFRCGDKKAEFPLEGLFAETTVVAASFYRRGTIWKMGAVGQGYKNGLKPLCESFGLNIMD